MIAALYVASGGCYFGLPDVDPWDESRDARIYAGPHPAPVESATPPIPEQIPAKPLPEFHETEPA